MDSQRQIMKVYAVADDDELLYVNHTARKALYRPKPGEIPVHLSDVASGKTELGFVLFCSFNLIIRLLFQLQC